jgi:hypothetical protein
MTKIKNDPRRYKKRSDLVTRRSTKVENGINECAEKRDTYLTAPIDRRYYIDFRRGRSGQQK